MIFRDRCTVYKRSVVTGNQVEPATVWTAQYTDVPCDVQPVGGREVGETVNILNYAVYVPEWVTVTRADRVIAGGKTFDIEAVLEQRSAKKLICKEVKR